MLLYAQRIHVGPERNRTIARAPAQGPHDACAADALGYVQSKLFQLARHEGRRAMLFKAELGVGMEITSPSRHIAQQRLFRSSVESHAIPSFPMAIARTTSSSTSAPATSMASSVCSAGL